MLSSHTFPRTFSMSFNRFNDITIEHCQQLSFDIKRDFALRGKAGVSIKPVLLSACANIFTQYFTTRTFEKDDEKFQQLIKNFDKIFWEVNQGYAADFLPFLMPFHMKRMKQLEQWSHEIRNFILEQIIGDRFKTWSIGNEPNDYIESLIDHVKQKLQPSMEWETVS
jgi:cytochrome P450 family 307 subfamily A